MNTKLTLAVCAGLANAIAPTVALSQTCICPSEGPPTPSSQFHTPCTELTLQDCHNTDTEGAWVDCYYTWEFICCEDDRIEYAGEYQYCHNPNC